MINIYNTNNSYNIYGTNVSVTNSNNNSTTFSVATTSVTNTNHQNWLHYTDTNTSVLYPVAPSPIANLFIGTNTKTIYGVGQGNSTVSSHLLLQNDMLYSVTQSITNPTPIVWNYNGIARDLVTDTANTRTMTTFSFVEPIVSSETLTGTYSFSSGTYTRHITATVYTALIQPFVRKYLTYICAKQTYNTAGGYTCSTVTGNYLSTKGAIVKSSSITTKIPTLTADFTGTAPWVPISYTKSTEFMTLYQFTGSEALYDEKVQSFPIGLLSRNNSTQCDMKMSKFIPWIDIDVCLYHAYNCYNSKTVELLQEQSINNYVGKSTTNNFATGYSWTSTSLPPLAVVQTKTSTVMTYNYFSTISASNGSFCAGSYTISATGTNSSTTFSTSDGLFYSDCSYTENQPYSTWTSSYSTYNNNFFIKSDWSTISTSYITNGMPSVTVTNIKEQWGGRTITHAWQNSSLATSVGRLMYQQAYASFSNNKITSLYRSLYIPYSSRTANTSTVSIALTNQEPYLQELGISVGPLAFADKMIMPCMSTISRTETVLITDEVSGTYSYTGLVNSNPVLSCSYVTITNTERYNNPRLMNN